ncbi:MAG: hypothetical protein R3E79_04285 [Caldilineaceae bacterium]
MKTRIDYSPPADNVLAGQVRPPPPARGDYGQQVNITLETLNLAMPTPLCLAPRRQQSFVSNLEGTAIDTVSFTAPRRYQIEVYGFQDLHPTSDDSRGECRPKS